MDAVEFLNEMVRHKVEVKKQKDTIVLHSVCALEKLKIEGKSLNVADHFTKDVVLPKHNGCFGMAGDRWFLFPELTKLATKHEKQDVENIACDGYYASTKTCEMAMSDATNKNYESILFFVDECISN
jgi:D-lactate dehydrogenase